MACELIRVDFKKGTIKSRLELGDKEPSVAEIMQPYCEALIDLGEENKAGGYPVDKVMLVSIPQASLVYDESSTDKGVVVECLKMVIEKLQKED